MTGEYHFFWGGPFSQWNIDGFDIDGVHYNCAEQWMMAEKARLFKDSETLAAIMKSSHPRDQKSCGRHVKGFVKEAWEAIQENGKPYCWNVVHKGSYAKYTQNPGLKQVLLETKGKTLVEASPWDKRWGIGLSEGAPGIEDPKNWQGKNWLGEVLTQLREDFLKAIAPVTEVRQPDED
jgi:hypothetical protein